MRQTLAEARVHSVTDETDHAGSHRPVSHRRDGGLPELPSRLSLTGRGLRRGTIPSVTDGTEALEASEALKSPFPGLCEVWLRMRGPRTDRPSNVSDINEDNARRDRHGCRDPDTGRPHRQMPSNRGLKRSQPVDSMALCSSPDPPLRN